MAFSLGINIRIGNLVFNYVHGCEISASYKQMTSTCVIRFPRNIRLKNEELKKLVKRGDAVTVSAGYNGKLREEFRGYVSVVKNTTPVEVHCEDEMFKLKTGTITHSWRNASLKEIASFIYSGPSKVFDAQIGPFTINKSTPALVLQELQRSLGMHSFFRKGVLVIGIPYDRTTASVHKLHFQKNIAENNGLEFRMKEDVKLKVKATSILPNNHKIEIELGDKDGQERTLHFYNMQESTLRKIAQSEIDKLKYDGYEGSFTSFGVPPIEMGDIVNLTDGRYPDNAGSYFVDQVRKSIGMGGFRRQSTLGPKA